MKLNSIRYIVVSLVAFLAVVGTANAVGVFYFDSSTNQFVLDGSLKISDPGTFKLFLRELNSADDSNLYINGRKDVQIRLDADNTDASRFKINNGSNDTKFAVAEDGKINTGIPTVIDANTTVNGTLTSTGAAYVASLSTNSVSTGSLSASGAASAASLSATSLSATSGSIGTLGVSGAINMGGRLSMPYGNDIFWTGASGTISNASFGHYTTATARYGGYGAFVWNVNGSSGMENKMVLGDNGVLYVVGDIYSHGVLMTSGASGGGACGNTVSAYTNLELFASGTGGYDDCSSTYSNSNSLEDTAYVATTTPGASVVYVRICYKKADVCTP